TFYLPSRQPYGIFHVRSPVGGRVDFPMADTSELVPELLEAGVHFGHQTKRWNPKMRPYIFEQKNQIYIINLDETVKQLQRSTAQAPNCAGTSTAFWKWRNCPMRSSSLTPPESRTRSMKRAGLISRQWRSSIPMLIRKSSIIPSRAMTMPSVPFA